MCCAVVVAVAVVVFVLVFGVEVGEREKRKGKRKIREESETGEVCSPAMCPCLMRNRNWRRSPPTLRPCPSQQPSLWHILEPDSSRQSLTEDWMKVR